MRDQEAMMIILDDILGIGDENVLLMTCQKAYDPAPTSEHHMYKRLEVKTRVGLLKDSSSLRRTVQSTRCRRKWLTIRSSQSLRKQ